MPGFGLPEAEEAKRKAEEQAQESADGAATEQDREPGEGAPEVDPAEEAARKEEEELEAQLSKLAALTPQAIAFEELPCHCSCRRSCLRGCCRVVMLTPMAAVLESCGTSSWPWLQSDYGNRAAWHQAGHEHLPEAPVLRCSRAPFLVFIDGELGDLAQLLTGVAQVLDSDRDR